MYQIRAYTEADHPLISSWWKAHSVAVIPHCALPKTSAVCEFEGVPVAASWVYLDNSISLGFMAWTCADPDAKGKVTLQAIHTVIKFLTTHTEEDLGYILMALSAQHGLTKLMEKHGFKNAAQPHDLLLKEKGGA